MFVSVLMLVGLSAIGMANRCSDVSQQKTFQSVRDVKNSDVQKVMQQISNGNQNVPSNLNWDSYIKYFRLSDAVSEAFRLQAASSEFCRVRFR